MDDEQNPAVDEAEIAEPIELKDTAEQIVKPPQTESVSQNAAVPETPPETKSPKEPDPEPTPHEPKVEEKPTASPPPKENKPKPTAKPKPVSNPESPKPEPTKPTPKPKPFDISTLDVRQLSDEQLKAASALWTKKNQKQLATLGVQKRQQTMQENLDAIVAYLAKDNGAPLPRIAKNTYIAPGTTSKYLCQLIAQGRVMATGWNAQRRYFKK